MKNFSKIFVILCSFLVLCIASCICSGFTFEKIKKQNTIECQAQKSINTIANIKKTDAIQAIAQRTDSILISIKKSDNNLLNFDSCSVFNRTSQLEKLFAYIYAKSFLDYIEKIAISLIFTEITPHAP